MTAVTGDYTFARPQHAVWPEGRPFDVPKTQTTLFETLADAAARDGAKPAVVFYGHVISYDALLDSVNRLAAYLQTECGVRPGDRVAVYSQNCPQFVMSFYAIARAGGVAVPVNPMNLADEADYIFENSGADTVFYAQDLADRVAPLMASGRIKNAIAICYSDYLPQETGLAVPDAISAPLGDLVEGAVPWTQAAACKAAPAPYDRTPDDMVLLPYTSGSTGKGKGCVHTNATVLHATRAIYDWFGFDGTDTYLSVAPMFHVVGMQCGMIAPIVTGATTVILPRWDREVAAALITEFKVSIWPTVPTMVIDFVNLPGLEDMDISSMHTIFGGGIAMPEAVAERLDQLIGVTFLEGYGMTETIAPTTANPRQAPKKQCGGVPVFNTDVVIANQDTFEQLPTGEIGEILISGPQVMLEYWQNPKANAETFVTLKGQRFLRSGDLGYVDDQGYVFIVDRLKRMINASGYKVWPTAVEADLYCHPDIAEACVIGSFDPRRGETVKALIVRKPGARVTGEEITKWAHGQMAAYKVPRIVEFVDSLPKSGSGKVLWRDLQTAENTRLEAEQKEEGK